jgi:hypothetical protein
VFGIAGRRVAEALVALFALLGFVFVPLGQKTAFEHAVAVFSTPAATLAFRELVATGYRLRDKLLEAALPARAEPPGPTGTQPKAEVPDLEPGTKPKRN